MEFETYVKFANKWPVCSLATVDGDQPQVRTFSMWFADTDGFYFSTNTVKAIYRQLAANPKVALAFYAPPKKPPSIQDVTPNLGTMMRVIGTAEFIDDAAMKERLLSQRPFLRPSAENVAVFRVKNGEAWFWTFSDSKRESEIERVRF
ncbi:MAG: pyridoxamine 5'-phosphate oxidase family protein [Halobacteriota archaeon]